ncbi:RNA binding motif domain-containing protein [Ditylenchus destructor]|nr:RNA binding motif domain-containing protein [Ditylenchus destructor]
MQETYVNIINQANKVQRVEKLKQSLAEKNFVKGLILKVTGLPDNTDTLKLKEFFASFGDVVYVTDSEKETLVRVVSEKENAAQELWEKAKAAGNGTVVYNQAQLTGEVLSGEEEENYWANFYKWKLAKAKVPRWARKGMQTNKENIPQGSCGKKRSAEDKAEVENVTKRIALKDCFNI